MTSLGISVPGNVKTLPICKVKVMNHENLDARSDAPEVAYEGEDEQEEFSSVMRDFSDVNLQTQAEKAVEDGINFNDHPDPPALSNSHSYENLQEVAEKMRMKHRDPGSPAMSHRSADRVMLKKHSSSQILPSGSRKIWWKLFLWSHRNRKGFHGRDSGLWPPNQWVAFSTESSSLDRVDEWVRDLENQPSDNDEKGNEDSAINFPLSTEYGRSSARSTAQLDWRSNQSEEMLHANNVIQSLNSSSTAAHVTGIGLKVIPMMSPYSSLRTVNLSNNSIGLQHFSHYEPQVKSSYTISELEQIIQHLFLAVHITAGSLPKGLHTLDLSRNKISAVEGLKDLSRLRVLDLSYNRISRIEQGLSNRQLIKELYLAGNKISYVEGLHRLAKLAVLDLSFNKITTTKAMGQLVANYNSLLALNLNKQPIKAQWAREVLNDNVARAALGSKNRNSRRRTERRVSPGGLLASNLHRSRERAGQGSRHSSRSRSHQHSPLHRSSTLAALR